jgi:ATP-dependent Clp protease ATP-binding subunit ClpA
MTKKPQCFFSETMNLTLGKVIHSLVNQNKHTLTLEDVFLTMLEVGARSRLWRIILRLKIKPENVKEVLQGKKVPGKKSTRDTAIKPSLELSAVLAIAETIAKENPSPHTRCLGVREFFLACVRHRDNKVMQALDECGFSLLSIASKAAE